MTGLVVAPTCPHCGSNSQVWINQITRKLRCHRVSCESQPDLAVSRKPRIKLSYGVWIVVGASKWDAPIQHVRAALEFCDKLNKQYTIAKAKEHYAL